jgi:long-chain fatty acid transport protein
MHPFTLLQVTQATLVTIGLLAASVGHATNGMNMEGYGPISTGMGGASAAYDNGNGAMANNPATLSLMGEGSKAEVALGYLGPAVTTTLMGQTSKSSGTSYFMPALGWTKTQNGVTYGVGVFAQGGMGTEYDATSPLAMGTGQDVRSELGVGRVIFPLSIQVNDRLTVGGSFDILWAGLDLKMALPASALGPASSGGFVTGGTLDVGGMLVGMGITPAVARVDFSNNNDFTGAANSMGTGAKLGLTYALSDGLRFGASYHLKTDLHDMKTKSGGAIMTVFGTGGEVVPIAGEIAINDFQWPATTTLGLAWQASESWMLAADVKHIGWKQVMKSFNMTFTNPMGNVQFALPQNWRNQTVLILGAAYKLDERWTLRGGLNLSSNPVPDQFVNPLFPAIVKNHATLGAGYAFDERSSIQASLTHAPKVTVRSGQGAIITHRQTNLQLMYSASY